jgi:hypothetical protein
MTQELMVRLAKLNIGIEKAAAKSGKRRIPGDGDGDGIPHEGRSKQSGGGTPRIASKLVRRTLKDFGFKEDKTTGTHQLMMDNSRGMAGFDVKNNLERGHWRITSAVYDAGKGINRYQMVTPDNTRLDMTIRNYSIKRPDGRHANVSLLRVKPAAPAA